jgi:hypothetical protein
MTFPLHVHICIECKVAFLSYRLAQITKYGHEYPLIPVGRLPWVQRRRKGKKSKLSQQAYEDHRVSWDETRALEIESNSRYRKYSYPLFYEQSVLICTYFALIFIFTTTNNLCL